VSEALRAAVIGLGVGAQHARAYSAHPDCRLVAVCDTDASKLADWPDVDTTTDASELLGRDDIDVVSVASWDDAHYEQVRAALESGKHVFAEKPLVLHEQEGVAIAELLSRPGTPRLSTNVPLRMSPRVELLKGWIDEGRLGQLFHVEGDYDYGRRHKLTEGWRGRIPYYSVVLGGAIHLVDLILWLTGASVTEVVAAAAGDIATRGTQFKHDDFVTATLRTDSGMTIKVNANLGCVSPHFHGLRVYGTEATFANGLPTAQLHTAGGTEVVDAPYPGVAKGDLIGPFVETILRDAPPLVSERDVFAALSVCFAIQRAVAGGGPVQVEYLL
jgi:predicted dehydrogenase